MTKKTKLIPFDYVEMLKGKNPVFREKQLEIKYVFNSGEMEHYPLTVIFLRPDRTTGSLKYTLSGKSRDMIEDEIPLWDLMLEIQLEEKTFYVNVYEGEGIKYYAHPTLISAQGSLVDDKAGILKVTYTDEDLIK